MWVIGGDVSEFRFKIREVSDRKDEGIKTHGLTREKVFRKSEVRGN